MHPFFLLFLYSIAALQLHTSSIAFTPGVPSLLYLSTRIFSFKATYSFTVTRPGWHWIRLHFFPIKSSDFDLTSAAFSVHTDELVLLHTVTLDDPTSERVGGERATANSEQAAIASGERATACSKLVEESWRLAACAPASSRSSKLALQRAAHAHELGLQRELALQRAAGCNELWLQRELAL